MSKFLRQNEITQFDAEVKHAYQSTGMLRNTVRVRTGVVGGSHKFPKMGKGTATKRTPQTDVIPMNIQHTRETAVLEDWNAPEYTDIFDQQKVNYEERQELAETIAGAIGRREDQIIIDAIDAAGTSLTVAKSVGGADSGINTAKARRTKRLMDQNSVPKGADRRTMLIHATGLEQLLGDDDANTVDKNAIKMLVDGEVTTWVGFTWIAMDDRDEGGLPLATGDRTNFAYDRMSTGLAIGIDFRTEVNYIPVKTSWLANGMFSAGAVAVDPNGIVEITSNDSAE